MPSVDIWKTRSLSWSYLNEQHPSRVSVILQSFELIDRCIDEYEMYAGTNVYARICGLTLLKAKNHALGSMSLVLDGLGQEAGALLRPMIEYIELLTYLRQFPDQAERAAENDLLTAGQRAKAIGGIYQGLREHLNIHASHSSYSSHFSLSHLLTPELSFRKLQQFVPHVLEANIRDLTVQLQLLLQEGILALQPVGSAKLFELAIEGDCLKTQMLDVFALNGS
jgi:hypothetical protein